MRRQIIKEKKRAKQDVKVIESLLQNFGICHPHIRISYRVDDTNVFMKPPTTTIKDSLTTIFGRKVTLNSDFIDFESSDLQINLIIPKKDIDCVNLSIVCQTAYSHVYINNRPVTYPEFDNVISKLLSAHFNDKIKTKKKPIYFLIIKIPPCDVDVNLEPNKTKVLLINAANVLEMVKKLIIDYYEITDSTEIITQVLNTTDELSINNSEVSLDTTENNSELEAVSPLAKQKKVQNNKSKLQNPRKILQRNEINKENLPANDTAIDEQVFKNETADQAVTDEETISQLPKVDLGEDFSTQDINLIPTLETQQVEAVMKEMSETKSPDASTSAISEVPKPIITASQWSRGHCPNLKVR